MSTPPPKLTSTVDKKFKKVESYGFFVVDVVYVFVCFSSVLMCWLHCQVQADEEDEVRSQDDLFYLCLPAIWPGGDLRADILSCVQSFYSIPTSPLMCLKSSLSGVMDQSMKTWL